MGSPIGMLLSFMIPLLVVKQVDSEPEAIRGDIFRLMLIEGAPSILIMILTVFFWFKGKSRETILIQQGKLNKDTIIDDRFQTVSIWK